MLNDDIDVSRPNPSLAEALWGAHEDIVSQIVNNKLEGGTGTGIEGWDKVVKWDEIHAPESPWSLRESIQEGWDW